MIVIIQGEVEFIGRAMARPLVKKAETKYEAPLFPPKLEWFQIYRGDLPAGELLAAFELFEVKSDTNTYFSIVFLFIL